MRGRLPSLTSSLFMLLNVFVCLCEEMVIGGNV